jgi:uncharacterized protein
MLQIAVSKIPPEGMDVSAELDPEAIHVGASGSESFVLQSGGRLSCHVERQDDETVHVKGRFQARVSLDCGRCLEPFQLRLEHDLDQFYLPHRADDAGPEDEEELSGRDLVVAYYREGQVDLGEMIREQIFLSIPMKRVCRDDCLGICPSCGLNRNMTQCECRAESTDPRLLPLEKLLDRSPLRRRG